MGFTRYSKGSFFRIFTQTPAIPFLILIIHVVLCDPKTSTFTCILDLYNHLIILCLVRSKVLPPQDHFVFGKVQGPTSAGDLHDEYSKKDV